MRRLLIPLALLVLIGPALAGDPIGGHEANQYWWDSTNNKWQAIGVGAPPLASVSVAPLTSTNLSGTVAVTNTFQSIQVLTAGRKGCTIQNNGTHNMDVFFGPIGSATAGASVILSAGQAVSCAVPGLGVLTDQISITGTATELFFANFQ